MFVDPLPSYVKVKLSSSNILLSWNSTWDEFYVEEFSYTNSCIRNWTTPNHLLEPFLLSSITRRVRISVCLDDFVEFNIGKCKYRAPAISLGYICLMQQCLEWCCLCQLWA